MSALPFTQNNVDYVLAVRRALYVDIFAAYSGKLYLVKIAGDITYKVDDTIRNMWRLSTDTFLASGLKWLKIVRTKVGEVHQSSQTADKDCILI